MSPTTDEAAREEPRESILHLLRTIGSRLAELAKLASARAIEKRGERGAKMHVDRLRRGAARAHDRRHAGTVIDRLKQVKEELGLDGILAELNPGSLIPHPQVMTALRLLCERGHPGVQVRTFDWGRATPSGASFLSVVA